MANTEGKPAMKTLVFMDLETTGLPSPGNHPRITELSLIAVDTVSLTSSQQVPRVKNKLTLCLYNDNLWYQKDFDQTTADLINLFLQRLAPPVCLVAHNGLAYDFPLLLAEYKRVNKDLVENLYCVDSLPMFRVLDPNDEEIEEKIEQETPDDPDENFDRLTPPPSTVKKDVSINHKKSVKRKLFDDDVNNNSSGDPAREHENEEILLFDDHEDDEDDRASVADSEATEDFYGTLPGIENLMDDLEEVGKKDKVDNEWDSDLDDLDDETLMSSTQEMTDESQLSQKSELSQRSDCSSLLLSQRSDSNSLLLSQKSDCSSLLLSQRLDCSSLMLTPPDSERKRNPPMNANESISEGPSPGTSQSTQRKPFQKFIYVSQGTPAKQVLPSQPRFKQYIMPNVTPSPKCQDAPLSQSSARSSEAVTPSKRTRFEKYVMPNVTPSPQPVNTSQGYQTATQSSGPPKMKFVKYVMPSPQTTPERTLTTQPSPGVTPQGFTSSQATGARTSLTTPERTPNKQSNFVKYVMPSPGVTPERFASSQPTPNTQPNFVKYVMPSPDVTPKRIANSQPTRTGTPSTNPGRNEPMPGSSGTGRNPNFRQFVMPSPDATPTKSESQFTSSRSETKDQLSTQLQSGPKLSTSYNTQNGKVKDSQDKQNELIGANKGLNGYNNCAKDYLKTKNTTHGSELREQIPSTSRQSVAVTPVAEASNAVLDKTANSNKPVPSTSNANNQVSLPKKSYKLENIHLRLLGHKPSQTHTAEDDSAALMRICHVRAYDVCNWINENAELYSSVVKPMYENKYRSSGLPQGVFPHQL